MRKPTRNYLKIINDFINLQSPFDIEILGTIIYGEGYPFISLHTHSKLAKYNVVINAGAHGTESIGVRVILRFLQEFDKELLNYYNFTIFPIVNPYGYRYACRKTGDKKYGNTGFNQVEANLTPESKLIRDAISNKIDLFIDIHADAKTGFYIYERKRPDKFSLAESSLKILIKNKLPILGTDTVYGEKCINGVIVTPIRDASMDHAMFTRGAMYSLCIEIPSNIHEDQQMVGGLVLLSEVLSKFKEIK